MMDMDQIAKQMIEAQANLMREAMGQQSFSAQKRTCEYCNTQYDWNLTNCPNCLAVGTAPSQGPQASPFTNFQQSSSQPGL